MLFAVLTLTAACATAPPPLVGAGEATVRVQKYGASLFVSAHVNDSPFDTLFLVDTGATHTVLSPLLARRLEIPVPDSAPRRTVTVFGGGKLTVPFIHVRRLAVGGASASDLTVGVYDAFPDARVVDGVLGTDFLHRFRMTVDTTQGVLHLQPLTSPPPR